ncbi:hypothetical protein [Bacillus salipaludis]|uniref:Uncharacterized protein n=1 Tax=Bacillus salipaludis TaxID=2547811 RepID=A0ABW8R949_9BACI
MKNNKQNNNKGTERLSEKDELKIKLEKQVALGIWIQSVGQLIEFVSLARLNLISDEVVANAENHILAGASIQTIGTFLEAIGVTGEITFPDGEQHLNAQKLAVTGDWLQALGAILEAVGGSEIIRAEQENHELFVP